MPMIADQKQAGNTTGADMAAVRDDLAPLFAHGYMRELMMLQYRTDGNSRESRRMQSARTDDLDDALQLVEEADRDGWHGIFVSVNPNTLPGGGPDHTRPSGDDVPKFTELFLDFDVQAAKNAKRPATADERYHAHKAAMHALSRLRWHAPNIRAVRMGTSGNGAYLFLRLDDVPNDAHHRAIIRAAGDALKTAVEAEYAGIDLDLDCIADPVRVRRISGTMNRRHGGTERCRLVYHPNALALPFRALESLAASVRTGDTTAEATAGPDGTERTATIELTDAEAALVAETMRAHRERGKLHNTSVMFAGFMAHARISRESARRVLSGVVADVDLDHRDRENALNDTYDRYDAGKPVAWRTPLERDDLAIVRKLDAAKATIHANHGIVTADAGPDESAPLPPVPAWPSGIFPKAIDDYLTAQARAVGVPVDMVAVPLMVFAAGTIGNAVELQVKKLWKVLPSLWAGVVAPPGKKKSPALMAGQWPVNALQKRLHDEWKADMAQYEADLQAWTDAPKETRGEKRKPPQMDHLYTTDATLEALVDILNRCHGVSIIRDELAGFIGAMDKYRGGKGDDRQQYLSLWAGAPVKVDRKAGGTVYTTHPAASVFGGIQPDYARELHSASGKRDGMVERFLLWWPDVPRSGWTDDDVDPALLDPVVDTFAALRSIRTRLALTTTDADAERVTVQMHPTAKRAFIDWYNANDTATEQATGLRQGFYSKLDSQLARVALVLHCLHNADDPRVMLTEATMRSAIDVAEFFRAHLDRVLPLIGDHSTGELVGLAARILRYLRAPELQLGDGWVKRATLYSRLRTVVADALTAELLGLQERGAVESRTVDTATKPSEQWRIVRHTHSSYSQDSQDSGTRGLGPEETANSANWANGQHGDKCHYLDDDDASGFMPFEGSI